MLIIRKHYLASVICSCLIFGSTMTSAQTITRADYARAQSFLWQNINNKQVFNLRLQTGYFPDSTGLWYIDYGPGKKDFYRIDLPSMERKPLFDQQQLADALSNLLKDTIAANALPFDRVVYLNKDSLELPIRGQRYALDLNTYHISPQKKATDDDPENESTSPDGKWVALTRDYNLFVRSTETGEVHQLSTDGQRLYEYGTYYGWGDLIEGENGERPPHFHVDWSSDSRWLNADLCDMRTAEKMYLLDWSVDTLYKPRLLSYYRGSPGDTTVVKMTPLFYDMQNLERPPVRLPARAYIANYSFHPIEGSNSLLVIDRDRGYKKADFLKVDLTTGEKELLFSESSETNVESPDARLFGQSGQFIFLSERSGWKQLYAFDLKKKEIRPLTQGDYFVHRVVQTDEEKGWIYFLASGMDQTVNPYFQYLYRVSINGGAVHSLTPETGHHIIRFSPDGRYFIDEYSTYAQPGVFSLRESLSGNVLL
ncbi:MAG: DPP IV N-terminal domain-containing protein, partial [Lewinella sp.]|nr:DPP IV N-terminal domain-containing protein [Lewinella sp.]